MRRILGAVFALAVVLSLVLMPVVVSAASGEDGIAKGQWDPLKWEDNQNSWHLYLMHWGRTPVGAMSHLRGLVGPKIGTNITCPTEPNLPFNPDAPNACITCACCSCHDVEQGLLAGCNDPTKCQVPAAATSCNAVGCDSSQGTCPANPVIPGTLPKCAGCWGVSLCFAMKSWAGADISNNVRVNDNHPNHFGTEACYGGGHGGDWGITGCAHTESCAQTWCLQDDLRTDPLSLK